MVPRSNSADGNWLVYSRRDDEQNAEVYLYDIRAKKEYNITQSPWNETTAQITPDGKTVVFSASTSACPAPAYRFWISPPGQGWSIVQDYSPASTYTWNATGLAGTYLLVFAALVPMLLRERSRVTLGDLALASIFPGIAITAAVVACAGEARMAYMVVWEYGHTKDDFHTAGRSGRAICAPGSSARTFQVSG